MWMGESTLVKTLPTLAYGIGPRVIIDASLPAPSENPAIDQLHPDPHSLEPSFHHLHLWWDCQGHGTFEESLDQNKDWQPDPRKLFYNVN